MKSSWEETVKRSKYHFNTERMDPRWDTVIGLGRLDPELWRHDIEDIIFQARPSTWSTRGYRKEGVAIPPQDLEAEENDLRSIGVDPEMIISNIGWQLPNSLQQIADSFALSDSMTRLHVQMPGQVWTRHIDKLDKFNPGSPDQIMRIMVQLSDWQPGHFWEFGNYHYRGWRAGDVITFDWANVPHSTANAGHLPRVTLQITGVRTAATSRYLGLIKNWA